MAAKVTFDFANKVIVPVGPVADTGLIQLNVQVDLYSDGKEDWLADTTLQKFRFPILPIGGQTVPGGQLGVTYLLVNGWRLAPDLNLTYTVPGSIDGSFPIYGDGGLNEAVRSENFTFDHRSTVPWQKVIVRKVGTPTDAFRVTLMDSTHATVYGQNEIGGDQVATSFEEHFIAFETPELVPFGEQIHYHIERTGVRDETNYYEVAYANNTFALETTTITIDNGVESAPIDVVLLGTIRIDVPYTLDIVGNLFTDSGLPVALAALNVNTQQTVSTLVEIVTDTTMANDLGLMRKILDNGLRTDPDTGKLTLYDDDGVTAIRQWDIFEDVAGTQPYRGQGSERRDAPVEI